MSESISTTALLTICSFFGLRLSSTGANFIYWVQLIVVNLINFYCLYLKSRWYPTENPKHVVVDFASWLMELWYVNICFHLTNKRADWIKLVEGMAETQNRLFGNSSVRANFAVTAKFVLISCLTLVTIVAELLLLSNYIDIATASIFILCTRLAKLYKLVGTVLVRCCMEVFLDQIRFVKRRINRLDRFDRGDACDEIVEIAGVCRSLRTSVEAFNGIFGWHLFVFFANYVSSALVDMVVFSISTTNSKFSPVMSAIPIFFFIVDTILVLLITIPGDKIEKGCEMLERECHEMILGKFSRSPLKNDLLTLSRSIKITNLRISAAAFYDVNKRTLLGLASVITTYFIVYLQFKN